MIPKIIHYCWFGGGELPELEFSCLQSWKFHLPDYQFRRWDESNFAYREYPFALRAYKLKKFAFVSDICRLVVLEAEGGVYLDTDMLLLKSLDAFLEHDFFIGEEKPGLISAGIIGSTIANPIIQELLLRYKKLEFVFERPVLIPDFLTQHLDISGLTIYPKEYFYPLPFSARGSDYREFLTDNSFAVHLWNHSWRTEVDYLHDKNFPKAIQTFGQNLRYRKSVLRSLEFLIRWTKFWLADRFSSSYQWYKRLK